jgi:hypothetical protein
MSHNIAARAAKEAGLPKPQIPDAVGLAFWRLSENLGDRYNFRKYPFLDEMVADGYEDCLKRMHNFDAAKGNAFSYFGLVVWRAFVRRIKLEKKYLRTKVELTERLNILGLTSDSHSKETTHHNVEVNQTDETLEYLR